MLTLSEEHQIQSVIHLPFPCIVSGCRKFMILVTKSIRYFIDSTNICNDSNTE